MYDINTPAVYLHESVAANPLYRGRVDRVVAALKTRVEPVVYRDEQLPDLVLKQGLLARRGIAMGAQAQVQAPILLFNTFRFDGSEAEQSRARLLEQGGMKESQCTAGLLGKGAFQWFDSNLPTDKHKDDKVCRPCWRIHLQEGCVHECKYCGLGGLLVSMVNIEDYCRHLGQIVARHPWQTTYLLDDDADPPALEPELGVLGPLVEWFGTLSGRYLVIHTKTWNTAWMRELRHNGNTIIVWSVSGPTQSRLIEPKTGTTEERIEAARIAQDAGYTIRYKFKPIIPVRGWREDAAYAVRRVFERTRPDVISLCCFMWMDVDEMKKRLPLDLLDPDCLRAAEESKEEVKDTRARPFPHRVRAEIYDVYLREIRKHSRDIPVSLSTENWAMWREFAPKLGMGPADYVCGCGPQSTPGLKKLDCNAFTVAVPDGAGIPGVSGLPA